MRMNRRAFLAGAPAAGLAPTRRNPGPAANKQFHVFDSALHAFANTKSIAITAIVGWIPCIDMK